MKNKAKKVQLVFGDDGGLDAREVKNAVFVTRPRKEGKDASRQNATADDVRKFIQLVSLDLAETRERSSD